MSNSMLVSITIGAVLSTAFKDAIGGAEKTLTRLGGVAQKLTERHEKMGRVMAGALKRGMDVDKLKGRYDAFGRAIERVSGSQKKLNDLMKAGVDLKSARGALRGDMMDAVGTAVAIGAPVLSSVRGAGNFEDQMKDISITGGFSRQEESALGATVRADAVKFNQTQEELGRGLSVLVAGGIQSAKELSAFSPILGKAATATRAGVDDLGRVFLALRDNMQITAKDSESSLNILAYAGKQGAVEIRDMAKFLPQLAPMMAALGSTGKEGVAEIGAALQIARRGAGTNDEAANNFKNFLAKITSPDTIKDFAKAGIDLKARLVELRREGLSPMEGALQLITEYMGKQGPDAARDFQAAMKSKDGAEMEAAVAKLNEGYKLGELFQDMQAMSFIKPAVAHGADLAEIKKGALAAGGDDLIGKDFAKRMEGFNEQWKALTIQARELGIAVGTALLPPLTGLIQSITPFVTTMGALVQRFPRLTAAVIGLTTGAVLGRVAWVTFAYGMNLWKAAALGVQTASARVGAKLALMQARTLLASGAIRTMNLSLLASPIGWIALAIGAAALLIYKYWKPISGFFKGLWTGIKEGLKGLEPAWAVFKKALPFIFPILIPLKMVWNELGKVWQWLKNLLKPVEDVGGAAESMGLRFGRVIGDILKGVVGLAAKMINAGANVMTNLWQGMKSMAHKPVELMREMAGKVRDFLPFSPAKTGPLKDLHKIKIMETIATGMRPAPMVNAMRAATVAAMLVTAAAPGSAMAENKSVPFSVMAENKSVPFSFSENKSAENKSVPFSVLPFSVPASPAPAAQNRQAAANITFSPVINIGGGTEDKVRAQVQQAMSISFEEFTRMMERHQREQKRRGFAG